MLGRFLGRAVGMKGEECSQRPQLICLSSLEMLEMGAVPLYPNINQALNAGCPWWG